MEGFGVMTWPSGATYEGDFFPGRAHGYGVLTWPRPWHGGPVNYKGDFVNKHLHGQGVLTWADGTTYSGDF